MSCGLYNSSDGCLNGYGSSPVPVPVQGLKQLTTVEEDTELIDGSYKGLGWPAISTPDRRATADNFLTNNQMPAQPWPLNDDILFDGLPNVGFPTYRQMPTYIPFVTNSQTKTFDSCSEKLEASYYSNETGQECSSIDSSNSFDDRCSSSLTTPNRSPIIEDSLHLLDLSPMPVPVQTFNNLWTTEEDTKLLFKRAQGFNWQDIFPEKTPSSCKERFDFLVERERSYSSREDCSSESNSLFTDDQCSSRMSSLSPIIGTDSTV
jgi:hypothetical protein